MVQRRPRYMVGYTPRVKGNWPGYPRASSAFQWPKSAGETTAATGTPEGVAAFGSVAATFVAAGGPAFLGINRISVRAHLTDFTRPSECSYRERGHHQCVGARERQQPRHPCVMPLAPN